MRRADDPHWRRLHAVAAAFPLTAAEHREFIGMLIGRPIRSRTELTRVEVQAAVAGYDGYLLMRFLLRDAAAAGRQLSEPETP